STGRARDGISVTATPAHGSSRRSIAGSLATGIGRLDAPENAVDQLEHGTGRTVRWKVLGAARATSGAKEVGQLAERDRSPGALGKLVQGTCSTGAEPLLLGLVGWQGRLRRRCPQRASTAIDDAFDLRHGELAPGGHRRYLALSNRVRHPRQHGG